MNKIFFLLLFWIASLNVTAQNYRRGIRIGWNYRMQKFETAGSYGRVKLLKDGRQALVYDEGRCCKIRYKQPKTTNFDAAITVATPPNGAHYTNAELLELYDGTLMYAWNQRPDTKIKVIYSYDGGYHWQDEQTLFETPASGFIENEGFSGVWEPAMIQLPSGEVQIYFANEFNVVGEDQNISMIRSTGKDINGTRIWHSNIEVPCFTFGARDGMPVPLVLQNNQGIALAIEDNGYDGKFQPGIIYSSIQESWEKGTRLGDSPNRWLAIAKGEPRGGGAPYLIQLNSGETLLSTQTNALADTRGADKDDMFRSRMFVYIGDALAHHFVTHSIPFPFLDEPGQGCVWNSLCQINDSIVMAVANVCGHPFQNGIWSNEGRIMHPLQSHQIDNNAEKRWDLAVSDVFIGAHSQANMHIYSLHSRDSLFMRFIVEDDYLCSPKPGDVITNADAVEFVYDPKCSNMEQIPAGVYRFIVSKDGNALVSRSTIVGWQEISASRHGMRSSIQKKVDGYIVDMAIPFDKIDGFPTNNKFTGYFVLHNKDIRNSKIYVYHEELSGTDIGCPSTWWQMSL